MLMIDVASGTFDELGFGETIRQGVRSAVAAVVGNRARHMTAEERATILVAERRQAGHANAQRPALEHDATTVEHAERRAAAFRIMAGVRV
jgi:hypothetical protein